MHIAHDNNTQTVAIAQTFEEAWDLLDDGNGEPVTVRDGARRVWLAWSDQDGEWWAVRPADEDDDVDPESKDPNRPVGPCPFELLPLPLTIAAALPYEASPVSVPISAEITGEITFRDGQAYVTGRVVDSIRELLAGRANREG